MSDVVRCDACGAAVADGARWCGGCGALVGPPPLPGRARPAAAGSDVVDGPVEVPVDDAVLDEQAPPRRPRRPRRGLRVAVALVAVAVAVAAVVLRPVEPTPLLGRLDVTTGATSTAAPGALEVVRWQLELGGPDRGLALPVDAGDGRVGLADGTVADVRGDRVTRTSVPSVPSPDGIEPLLVPQQGVPEPDEDLLLELRDAGTGRLLERHDVEVDAGGPGPVGVVGRADGGVLARDGSGGLLLLDLQGRLRWRASRAVAAPQEPVVVDRWLVLPARDGTGLHVALDATTGDEVGRFAPLASSDLPRVLPDERDPDRALAVALDGGTVVAWSLPGGDEVWRTEVLVGPGGVRLAVADGVVVAAVDPTDGPAVVHRLAPADGAIAATLPGASPPIGADGGVRAVVVDGLAVVADPGGVVARRFADGLAAWSVPLDGVRDLTVVGDLLVATTPVRQAVVAPATGAVLRSVRASVGPTALPRAVAGGRVAVGGAGEDADELSWVRLATGAPGRLAGVLGTGVDTTGLRLLGVDPSGDPLLARVGADDRVVLQDLDRGPVPLDLPTTDAVAATLPEVVGLAGHRLVLGLDGDRLALADTRDGAVVVRDGLVPTAVVGQVVLARAAGGDLVALDVDGRERWRSDDLRLRGATAVDGGGVVVLAGGPAERVVAVDAATGRVVWDVDPGAPVAAGPVVADDEVVVVDADGVVRAWALADGDLRWRTRVEGAVSLTAGGPAVVVGGAGEVVVLDRTGEVVDRLGVGVGPVRRVVVAGALVLCVVDGTLVAAGPDDGTVPEDDRIDLP